MSPEQAISPETATRSELSESEIRHVFELLQLSTEDQPTVPALRDVDTANHNKEILYFPVSGSCSPLNKE